MMINRKNLVTIIIGIFLAIVSVVGLIAFLNRDNGTMTLTIAPEQATLSYGDAHKTVKYGQVISLKNGEYDLTFSRDGFKTVKQKVTIKKAEQTNVYAYLEPVTDEAKAIMATGNNQFYKEAVIGHGIKEGGKKLTEENPILKVLPILQQNYTIEPCSVPADYTGPGDDKEIAICISALSDGSYAKALEDIKERGHDPAEYLVKRVTN